MDNYSDLQPWDMQSYETQNQFNAFCVYRDMGIDGTKRTFVSVAEKCQKSCSLIRRWKDKNNWEERSRFFDIEKDREQIAERKKQIGQMRKRYATMGNALFAKSARKLQAMTVDEMAVGDIARLTDLAIKLESIGLCVATETIRAEITGTDGEPLTPVQIYIPYNNREENKGLTEKEKIKGESELEE